MSKGSERVRKWRNRHQDIARDMRRREDARKGGFETAPKESLCPPRPIDHQCQLCGKPSEWRRIGRTGKLGPGLYLDHCHKTGIFRGWICCRCNMTLGHVEATGIDKILVYLNRVTSN